MIVQKIITFFCVLPALALAQNQTIPKELSTPDSYQSSFGELNYLDGVPTKETAMEVRDALDIIRGVDVFMNSFRGASAYAIRQGFLDIGAEDNSVVIFSKLMDSNSLFLTANADTIYYLSVIDLSNGPMIIEQPSDGLGTINDMWFSWIIDIGYPGPDRGMGGKYLIVPPVYKGHLPDSGFHVAHSKTNRVLYAARAYLRDNDPAPSIDNIKKNLKIYRYEPGGYGTSIATALNGKVKLGSIKQPPETKFVEASGKVFNTIPPSDYSFFEMINENVQQEPATSYDVELAGQLAAIGIVKGKSFKPDERLKKILSDAAAIGNAAGRVLNWHYSVIHPEWAYYKDSSWGSMLWEGGYNFETPPPEFTAEGYFKPNSPTGARTLDSRTAFYYAYTLDSPGMIMRVPGVGSQYLMAFLDAEKNPFDGSEAYKVTLPPNIPAEKFWSLTLYDNQSRSMLATSQKYPRAGSQNYPSPSAEANSNGSTTVYFSPELPQGVSKGNWIQTVPGKGWFVILRLYNPAASFFDKSWQISEIELLK